jgi:hypothetical protein
MFDFYCTYRPDYILTGVKDVIINNLASTHASELHGTNSIGKLQIPF